MKVCEHCGKELKGREVHVKAPESALHPGQPVFGGRVKCFVLLDLDSFMLPEKKP